MKIYIVGPFKTATHTFETRFSTIPNATTRRSHCTEIINFSDTDQKIIIVPLRSASKIYPSAFFQDITSPQYPYCFSTSQETVINTHPLQLVKFYQQHDFSSHEWLNYTHIINSLEQHLGLDLNHFKNLNDDFFETADPPFYVIQRDNTILAFYHVKHLNNRNIFQDFAQQLGLKNLPPNFFDGNNNIGYSSEINQTKWYTTIYQQFLKILETTNN